MFLVVADGDDVGVDFFYDVHVFFFEIFVAEDDFVNAVEGFDDLHAGFFVVEGFAFFAFCCAVSGYDDVEFVTEFF